MHHNDTWHLFGTLHWSRTRSLRPTPVQGPCFCPLQTPALSPSLSTLPASPWQPTVTLAQRRCSSRGLQFDDTSDAAKGAGKWTICCRFSGDTSFDLWPLGAFSVKTETSNDLPNSLLKPSGEDVYWSAKLDPIMLRKAHIVILQ